MCAIGIVYEIFPYKKRKNHLTKTDETSSLSLFSFPQSSGRIVK